MDISKPIEIDYLYNAADKLYYQFARSCGLSTCAYWMLYDIERAGGKAPLKALTESWSFSKQTINSALKMLATQGLIKLEFCEGSRKNKEAYLTEIGRDFVVKHITPAMQAEDRAFQALSVDERVRLLELVRKYTAALEQEFKIMQDAHGEESA